MSEQQKNYSKVSPVVQQALGKLNVRMADLMEQINIVIKTLIEENMTLQEKLDNIRSQQQKQLLLQSKKEVSG
ncbi:MAG: hypothetical protein FWD52_08770 [Candidatus Bathyarchaeota archaeon]|nr:hypothetical protein [Candidatus Termiticorpusculum sp.]